MGCNGLLDPLVSASKQRRWQFEAERLGGDQVHDEVELGRLLDRNVGRFGPAQDLVDKVASVPEHSDGRPWC
jgi:hypothetical protein